MQVKKCINSWAVPLAGKCPDLEKQSAAISVTVCALEGGWPEQSLGRWGTKVDELEDQILFGQLGFLFHWGPLETWTEVTSKPQDDRPGKRSAPLKDFLAGHQLEMLCVWLLNLMFDSSRNCPCDAGGVKNPHGSVEVSLDWRWQDRAYGFTFLEFGRQESAKLNQLKNRISLAWWKFRYLSVWIYSRFLWFVYHKQPSIQFLRSFRVSLMVHDFQYCSSWPPGKVSVHGLIVSLVSEASAIATMFSRYREGWGWELLWNIALILRRSQKEGNIL